MRGLVMYSQIPQRLPLGVARPKVLLAERLLLVGRDFVVRDDDRLASPAVLLVQPHHRVRGRAGAGEEVDSTVASGLIRNKEAQNVLDSIRGTSETGRICRG